jgi:hypothetical protein
MDNKNIELRSSVVEATQKGKLMTSDKIKKTADGLKFYRLFLCPAEASTSSHFACRVAAGYFYFAGVSQ